MNEIAWTFAVICIAQSAVIVFLAMALCKKSVDGGKNQEVGKGSVNRSDAMKAYWAKKKAGGKTVSS